MYRVTRIPNVQSFRAHADQVGMLPIGKILACETRTRSNPTVKSPRVFPEIIRFLRFRNVTLTAANKIGFPLWWLFSPLYGYVPNVIRAETPNLTLIPISRVPPLTVFSNRQKHKTKKKHLPNAKVVGWIPLNGVRDSCYSFLKKSNG